MVSISKNTKVKRGKKRRYRSTQKDQERKEKKKQGKRRPPVGILKPDWDINGGKTHNIKFKGKPIFRLLSEETKDIKRNIKIA